VEKSCHDTGPGGYVFWWMSEPIGHAVTDYDLMTKAQARKELECRKEIAKKPDSIRVGRQKSSLHAWRLGQAKFIMSTWKNANYEPKMTIKEFLKQFPSEEDTEWFS
jgi:hypothetical protein